MSTQPLCESQVRGEDEIFVEPMVIDDSANAHIILKASSLIFHQQM